MALVVETIGSVPLSLQLCREGVGGITGKSPTVALRNTVDGKYLDWNDLTFKASGWVTKYGSMDEGERGNYQRLFHPQDVGAVAGTIMVAEYHVDDGVDVVGDASDLLVFVRSGQDTSLLRKALTNRMWESGGAPGNLVLFDDDDSTPLLNWHLTDAGGGGVAETVGAPARRSKAT